MKVRHGRWADTRTIVAVMALGIPLAILLAIPPTTAPAQDTDHGAHYVVLPPADDWGATGHVATGLMMRRMEGVKRVLMIAAHPDDENTTLIAALARSYGAETAYLSLTRGAGGQNLIGSELWEGLGVVRTGELEAARRVDGGRQYFTRAFDFGFSKTAAETLSIWPVEEVLGDIVRVIRSFRPHVIVSVFSGAPSDGHGHHQAAGVLAREAFRAAGDPDRFPELGLEPWSPAKFYVSRRRLAGRAAGGVPTVEPTPVRLDAGRLDPFTGRSPSQIAGESRSQHRSQQMGSSEPLGPRSTGANYVEGRVGAGTGFFDNVDTTLAGAASGLPEPLRRGIAPFLDGYRSALEAARASFGMELDESAGYLGDALGHLQRAHAAQYRHCPAPSDDLPANPEPESNAGRARAARMERAEEEAGREPAGRDVAGSQCASLSAEFETATTAKLAQTTRAVMAASGIVVDVRAARPLLVAGSSVMVSAIIWNGSDRNLPRTSASLDLPEGWVARASSVDGVDGDTIRPGSLASFSFMIELPADAEVSRQYYLREAREEGSYNWPEESAALALPRDPPPVSARISFELGESGVPVRVSRGWRFVGVDRERGEFSKPVLVVPGVTVSVEPGAVVWPRGRDGSAAVTVTVRTENQSGQSGSIELDAPDGWTISPTSSAFELVGAGRESSAHFELRPNGEPRLGEHRLGVFARVPEGTEYRETLNLIDYEHIERTPLYSSSDLVVSVIPVAVRPDLRVGYIMGPGDAGPEAIRQMGAQVELLDEGELGDGDLGRFDAIVLGVRAYETREDLRAANRRLLDFAEAGGTVVSQYNQYRFSGGGYAPHPLLISRPAARVSVETAPVRILEPDAPIFRAPNPISDDDFRGWVQERGLYFAGEWDDAYLPMLELNDPGEPPRRGSLLVAPVGEGVFVYAALSFFRQWSARVPGAYRLFANLISLDAEAWREFLADR